MTLYRCDVCNVFEYESQRGDPVTHILPGTEPKDFPADWACPICSSDQTHLIPVPFFAAPSHTNTCPLCGAPVTHTLPPADSPVLSNYLSAWERPSDDLEVHMADIHTMAVTGKSIIEPMRTKKPVISWDDILIKGAQIATLPLEQRDVCQYPHGDRPEGTASDGNRNPCFCHPHVIRGTFKGSENGDCTRHCSSPDCHGIR